MKYHQSIKTRTPMAKLNNANINNDGAPKKKHTATTMSNTGLAMSSDKGTARTGMTNVENHQNERYINAPGNTNPNPSIHAHLSQLIRILFTYLL